MPTWGTMRTRIADELARSDLSDQIVIAMKSAVRHYRWSERFWLTEGTATFLTVDGQEAYTDAQTSYALLYLAAVDAVHVTDGTDRFPLVKMNYAEFLELATDTTTEGKPVYYTIYGDQLRLWPIPDAVYGITISYKDAEVSTGFRTFPYIAPLTDDTTPNDLAEGFWTTEAEELIRCRAKADLFEHVIRDYQEADRMRAREQYALAALRNIENRRHGSGFVVSSCL